MRILNRNLKLSCLFIILFFAEIFTEKAALSSNEIIIKGDPEKANLSDLPKIDFNYDLDSYESEFEPAKELVGLINRPEDLLGIKENEIDLDFDRKASFKKEKN